MNAVERKSYNARHSFPPASAPNFIWRSDINPSKKKQKEKDYSKIISLIPSSASLYTTPHDQQFYVDTFMYHQETRK